MAAIASWTNEKCCLPMPSNVMRTSREWGREKDSGSSFRVGDLKSYEIFIDFLGHQRSASRQKSWIIFDGHIHRPLRNTVHPQVFVELI